MRVIAQQHDTVDAICWRHLGATAHVVEETLALNPGLAALGVILPAGTPVILPDAVPTHTTTSRVTLWD